MAMVPLRSPLVRLAIGLLAFVTVWGYFSLPFGGQHVVSLDKSVALPPPLPNSEDDTGYYASKSATKFCKAHSYSPFPLRRGTSRRKVYDLMMVNTELDFLEIRLSTLYDYVDYFVIVESPRTFQNTEKPLIIKQNWDMFKKWHKKMIYHELEFPEWFDPKRTWDFEDLQRDAMFDQVFPKLKDDQKPASHDVIIVADVDEIPRPATVSVLRYCEYPRRLTISSKFYYYSFQFLHDGHEWLHPQATYYEGQNTIKPNALRNSDGGIPFLRFLEAGTLSNAAWHCSSCFATIDQFLNKMGSFSHTWMNGKEYQQPKKIADAVRDGKDVWGRSRDTFSRVDNNKDVPPMLLENQERFRYMLNRDGPTAGFEDYP